MSKTCQYNNCDRGCYGEFCLMHKPRKRITQKGKQSIKYDEWRDTIAIPHLDKDGHYCACCGTGGSLDVDHINGRRGLKYELSNIQYLCRFPCHRNKTDGKECIH